MDEPGDASLQVPVLAKMSALVSLNLAISALFQRWRAKQTFGPRRRQGRFQQLFNEKKQKKRNPRSNLALNVSSNMIGSRPDQHIRGGLPAEGPSLLSPLPNASGPRDRNDALATVAARRLK